MPGLMAAVSMLIFPTTALPAIEGELNQVLLSLMVRYYQKPHPF